MEQGSRVHCHVQDRGARRIVFRFEAALPLPRAAAELCSIRSHGQLRASFELRKFACCDLALTWQCLLRGWHYGPPALYFGQQHPLIS